MARTWKSTLFSLVILIFWFLIPTMGMAGTITFETRGSWDNVNFSTSISQTFTSGSNSLTVGFVGITNTNIPPTPMDGVNFGSFTFSGSGLNVPGSNFYLKILQSVPNPLGGQDQIFESTFAGKINVGSGATGNFTVSFIQTSLTLLGSPTNVTYTLKPSYTEPVRSYADLPIKGGVAVPEPTLLVLLGIGMGAVSLLAYRLGC